jgi:murein DD-endopeptidase MepM/ murein hydrolase activator NlpD
MSTPGRTGRVVLLAAALAAAGGVAGTTRSSSAAPADTTSTTSTTSTTPAEASDAATTRIEVAASVTKPAKRLRQVGTLLFPMNPTPRCYILNNFGDPRGGGRTHEGVDTMATLGQEIYAVVDGTLTRQATAESPLSGNAWGLTATVGGSYYFYAHLSAFADGLAVGSKVTRGQLIGYVGDTGDAGPGNYHLHFEVHPGSQKNAAVDPVPLLEIPAACTLAKKT